MTYQSCLASDTSAWIMLEVNASPSSCVVEFWIQNVTAPGWMEGCGLHLAQSLQSVFYGWLSGKNLPIFREEKLCISPWGRADDPLRPLCCVYASSNSASRQGRRAVKKIRVLKSAGTDHMFKMWNYSVKLMTKLARNTHVHLAPNVS